MRYMDHDSEPNSQNVSIWSQLNGHGRIFNDIGCSLSQSIISKIFDCVKGGRMQKRGGRQGQKRETEKEIAFNFCQIHHGNYGGAPMTPAPVAMFE